MNSHEPTTSSSNRLSLTIDLRLVVGALLLVIAVMFFIWKPWSNAPAESRTVEVTGEAKVTAKPDEFVFYPNYQFTNADKNVALAALNKKSDEVVTKLKELGVQESKIKTNSSGYDYPLYVQEGSGDVTYTLQITVVTASLEAAQKVQDYLLTTTPTGSVSPQAGFSDSKRKELENKAREQATKDARAKVERMSDNLGFKIGEVKSVTDGSGFNTLPIRGREMAATAVDDAKSLAVMPGENDLNYSVTVEYFIK